MEYLLKGGTAREVVAIVAFLALMVSLVSRMVQEQRQTGTRKDQSPGSNR